MKWYVQTYDKNDNAILGSGNGAFFHDLKTLRGVINRLRKWRFKSSAVTIRIYSVVGGSSKDNLQYTGTIKDGKLI